MENPTDIVELEEDEENSSEEEFVDGELREDLDAALSADFAFTGKYAHSAVLDNVPLPGLSVDGLGPIGLPLSPRDAESLRSHAKQAPFGHGDKTVVDTAVRHTWEVAAGAVKFSNPAWNKFVAETVVKEAVQALGVSYSPAIAPRCDLYKLLLYETESHFSPHQDTEKEPGMFATIIIILPSEYTGGQVRVSHGAKNTTFDTAPFSAVGFTLLTWYTDVKHEVKPITSGFRLALSYKLIHTARNTLPPSIPDSDAAIQNLTTVLRNWDEQRYGDEVDQVAYILDHEYSSKSLKRTSLKGIDAHLVAVLVRICKKESLNLKFHLACIKHTLSGTPSMDEPASNWMYGKAGKRRFSDSGFALEEYYDGDTEIVHLANLDGTPAKKSITIEEEDLMPKTEFQELDPDYTEYAGYMGNEPGDTSYLYYRSVLLISVA
ncbi:ARM repeat-containing protein [Favolaschia claudopus]|uniref:ARM repeat-containing protein n=1 Tax=Favolaschia claudopus TaxID=2862362 RepID=A0AAW0ECX7_9AGAR